MKKGFTLIELLAVIAILAVILLIAVPKVLDVVAEVKLKAYDLTVKSILNAANVYVAKNVEIMPIDNVSLQTLVNDKLLDSIPIDPRDGKEIPANSLVNITEDGNGSYVFNYNVDPFYETTGSISDYIATYNDGFIYTFSEIRYSQLEEVYLKVDQNDLEQSITIKINNNILVSAINGTNSTREWKEYLIPSEYLNYDDINIVRIYHNGGSADWGYIYEVILDGS